MAHPEIDSSVELEEDLELDFLRYFYEQVGYALGPADDDIYNAIKEDYVKRTGNLLPKLYRRDG